MEYLDDTSGLIPASLPPLPPDAAQIGAGEWNISGVLVGVGILDAYVDFVFEGEFSETRLEWISLGQLSFVAEPSKAKAPLGSLKPILVEEETSLSGRSSFVFVDDAERHRRTCADLLGRGHSHALAVVRRYHREAPPVDPCVNLESFRDLCRRWYWTKRLRGLAQRAWPSCDDVVVYGRHDFASRGGVPTPRICLRCQSIEEPEEASTEAALWFLSVEDRQSDEECPFGTEDKIKIEMEVETSEMRKIVKGYWNEIALQLKVVLSCFAK